ncbi:expressed unknown protein [Seminavis robusta]|uniref:DUF6824 domain-containing protein n=1 Tax=Seminavis robusta TaxID=568900 RepID=A0A9N8DDI5_9STRA|nr:expressed unknown protein [Seminavis robusta]|eukprot:Sro73_g040440.1 n/a (499) ;mRNA; r:89342-91140
MCLATQIGFTGVKYRIPSHPRDSTLLQPRLCKIENNKMLHCKPPQGGKFVIVGYHPAGPGAFQPQQPQQCGHPAFPIPVGYQHPPFPYPPLPAGAVPMHYRPFWAPNTAAPRAAPQTTVPVKAPEPIIPHDNDILMGRGGKNNLHKGNGRLRKMARDLRQAYIKSSKKDKSQMSRDLVKRVQAMTPPGRFLKRNNTSNGWEVVDEEYAREKASQCLRDAVTFKGFRPFNDGSTSGSSTADETDSAPSSQSSTPRSGTPVPMEDEQQQESSSTSSTNVITPEANRPPTTAAQGAEDALELPTLNSSNKDKQEHKPATIAAEQTERPTGKLLLAAVEPLLEVLREARIEENRSEPLLFAVDMRRPRSRLSAPNNNTFVPMAPRKEEEDDAMSLPSVSAHSHHHSVVEEDGDAWEFGLDLCDENDDDEVEDPLQPLPLDYQASPKRARFGTWDHDAVDENSSSTNASSEPCFANIPLAMDVGTGDVLMATEEDSPFDSDFF